MYQKMFNFFSFRPMMHSNLMEEMNRDKPFGCDKCSYRFLCEKSLKEHILKFHSQHYECIYCARNFDLQENENFRKHMFR